MAIQVRRYLVSTAPLSRLLKRGRVPTVLACRARTWRGLAGFSFHRYPDEFHHGFLREAAFIVTAGCSTTELQGNMGHLLMNALVDGKSPALRH